MFHQSRARMVWPHVVIDKGAQFDLTQKDTYEFGYGVRFHGGRYSAGLKVGEGSYLYCTNIDCHPDYRVFIGKACRIAHGTYINSYDSHEPSERAPVTIGNECWLGWRSIVLKGVTLGDRVWVGAGSVVTNDFDDDCVIGGNPARLIRKR